MLGPSRSRIETEIVKAYWGEYQIAIRHNDLIGVREAESSMAYLLATLLNFHLHDEYWDNSFADDLLDGQYNDSETVMTARGLMCWQNPLGRNMLSPFVGRFEGDHQSVGLHNYVLLFAATGPDGGPLAIPYTNDCGRRIELLNNAPQDDASWFWTFRRSDL